MNVFLPVVSIASQRYVPTLDLRSGERDFTTLRFGHPDTLEDVDDRAALETLVSTYPRLPIEGIAGFETGALVEQYLRIGAVSRELAFDQAKEYYASGVSVDRSYLESESYLDAVEELLCTALHALHPPYEERGSVWSVRILGTPRRASIIHEEDARFVKDSFIAFENEFSVGKRILDSRSGRVRVARYPLSADPLVSVPRYFGDS